jgi:hypothetical protein
MPTSHTYLPPPYDALLTRADVARYGDVLSAQQAAALQLRLAGFLYVWIGRQLGVTAPRAHNVVQQACERLAHAKQLAEARAPCEDTP